MSIRTTDYCPTRLTSRMGILVTTALLAILLAACQGPVQREAPPQEAEPLADAQPAPDEILPPAKRVRKAIQALQTGDKESARNQLNWALQDKPNLRVAKKLLEQMDADPIRYLGERYSIYTVMPGDSLSIIAKDQLNDPLKFVILARYNDIDNPSQLKAGQKIKIPGRGKTTPAAVKPKTVTSEKPADEQKLPQEATSSGESSTTEALTHSDTSAGSRDVKSQPNQSESIREQVLEQQAQGESAPPAETAVPERPTPEMIQQTARRHHAAGNLSNAIAVMEQAGDISSHTTAFRNQLIGYYGEMADQLANQDKLDEARSVLEKAVILDSSNDSTINKLIAIEDRIEAHRLYRQGTRLMQAGKLEAAYEAFSQAFTYEPTNKDIAAAHEKSKVELTDNYHRQAMQLFRKHELDEAIVFWDKILRIDPQHNLAPGYRARAVELKNNLQKIGQ